MSEPQQHSLPPHVTGAGQPGMPPYASALPAPAPSDHVSPQSAHPAPQNFAHGPYGHASYAQPPHPSSAPTPTNLPGRVGFIIGIVALALGFAASLSVQSLYRLGAWDIAPFLNGASLLLTFVGSALALVFGIIGLRRPQSPHALAGIAVGLGIAGVASGLLNIFLGAFGWLFYR